MHTMHCSSFPLRKTLLAPAIGAASQTTMVIDAAAAKQPDGEILIVGANETSDSKFGGDLVAPAFPNGQIAHGGHLGMFGGQKVMDIPFDVVDYTSKLIQDQQAKTIVGVVSSDASVQAVQDYDNFAKIYRIRGLKLDGNDMTMGGLAGVISRQVMDTQILEHVEIFKGADSLLNDTASNGVDGMINLEPKRAEDLPAACIGVDYTSDSQVGDTLDLGRRFGDNNQFDTRANLMHCEDEGAADNDKHCITLALLGPDYRGGRFRSSLDFGYQKKTFHGGTMGINISGTGFVSVLSDSNKNYSRRWGYSGIESEFGMVKAGYSLTDSWTVYSALGDQHLHGIGTYSTPKLLNKNGDATVGRLDTDRITDAIDGMGGVHGDFDTGTVLHKVNPGYAAQVHTDVTAWRTLARNPTTSIYDNRDVTMPDNAYFDGNYHDLLITSRSHTQGQLLSDTLGFFNNKMLFIAVARHREVVVRSHGNAIGPEDTSSRYTQSRWTPTLGLVYKPREQLPLYANHTEALQPGSVAPTTAADAGQSTGITYSKQNEVGTKIDYGTIGGSLVLFEIKKPNAVSDTTGNYGLDGEQRNHGVEMNVFGEPMLELRLDASTVWLDTKQTETAKGVTDGKNAIGAANFYVAFGAEYDIKPVEDLTATARVNHSGSQYADAANTKKLDNHATLDLGLRYRTRLNADQNEITWYVGVINVASEKYWSDINDTDTYLLGDDPRTVRVSMNCDF